MENNKNSQNNLPDFSDIDDTAEIIEQVERPDKSAEEEIAVDGIRARHRERRLANAERTKAKMERKGKLYTHLGRVALGEAPDHVTGPKPQTAPERIMDVRISRRAEKLRRRNAHKAQAKEIYGEDKVEPAPSVKHAAKATLYSRTLGRLKREETAAGRKPVKPDMTLWESVKMNAMRLFDGAKIPGKTSLRRTIDRGLVISRAITGRKTFSESRKDWYEVGAADMKLGNNAHRYSRRKARKNEEKTSLMADQPILSAWRSFRLRRAEARIAKLSQSGGSKTETEQSDSEIERAQQKPSNWDALNELIKYMNEKAETEGLRDRIDGLTGLVWRDPENGAIYMVGDKQVTGEVERTVKLPGHTSKVLIKDANGKVVEKDRDFDGPVVKSKIHRPGRPDLQHKTGNVRYEVIRIPDSIKPEDRRRVIEEALDPNNTSILTERSTSGSVLTELELKKVIDSVPSIDDFDVRTLKPKETAKPTISARKKKVRVF